MTAPALPGAAPDPAPGRNDPARLPPEVERALMAFARTTTLTPESVETAAALRTAIRAALDKRGEVSAASAASARALGGDGEPVAWGVGSRVVVIGKALNEGHNFVGRTGVVVEPIDHAKARWVRFDGDDNKTSVPMRYLAVAPAATGDTGEVEKAARRLLDALYTGGSKAQSEAMVELAAVLPAATGGPDARCTPFATRPAAPASVERRMAFLNVEAAVEAAVKAEREACAKAIYAVRVVHRAEVERAVAEERAACAQVLNQMGDDDMASDREIAKWERAIEAIRARGAKS